jgi:F-type H+-transporting ATPase subunit epsilon
VIHLTVVTPTRNLIEAQVDEVILPGKLGYLGVLPGHAPLLTSLAVGRISYRRGGETRDISVAWGFAEVLPDRVTVLCDVAERAEDIDLERARQARQRAEERLRHGGEDLDWDRATIALEKAVVRIQVAEKR